MFCHSSARYGGAQGALMRILPARRMTPWPVQRGGWGRIGSPCSSPPELLSVHCVGANCGGRLFTTKLPVVVQNLAHQLLNHLLPDDAILLACQFRDCLGDRINDVICFSPAGETVARSAPGTHAAAAILFQRVCRRHLYRCIGLRTRSLKDPHDARLRPFNRHTLKPCATPASGAN